MADDTGKKRSYQILRPSGEFFAYCTLKTFNSYIKRNMCKIINDHTIQLSFEPRIKDTTNFTYVYSLDGKDNVCCVCLSQDTEDDPMNIHNIVPPSFLKKLNKGRDDNNKNKILLCIDCSAKYNSKQEELKKEILKEFNIITSKKNLKLKSCAIVCARIHSRYPDMYLKKQLSIEKVLGYKPKLEELNKFIDLPLYEFIDDSKINPDIDLNNPFDYIIDYYVKNNKIDEFRKRWLTHFVDTMNPVNLPKYINLE